MLFPSGSCKIFHLTGLRRTKTPIFGLTSDFELLGDQEPVKWYSPCHYTSKCEIFSHFSEVMDQTLFGEKSWDGILSIC